MSMSWRAQKRGVQSPLLDVEEAVSEAIELVISGEVELEVIVEEIDGVWDSEERKVVQHVAHGCSCNLGPDHSPCQSA